MALRGKDDPQRKSRLTKCDPLTDMDAGAFIRAYAPDPKELEARQDGKTEVLLMNTRMIVNYFSR